MLSHFISYCHKHQPLSPKFIDYIKADARIVEINRNTQIETFASKRPGVLFIITGIVRKYINYKTKEISIDFISENDFIDFTGQFEQNSNPHEIIMQTLEPTKMAYLPYHLLEKLQTECFEYWPLISILRSNKITHLNNQALISRIPNGAERYRMFCNTNSNYRRIAAKYLASYLAMREETLSRIKNGLRNI